jgi:hypothetical protein
MLQTVFAITVTSNVSGLQRYLIKISSKLTCELTSPQLLRVIYEASTVWKPRFDPRQVHVECEVDKVALRQVSFLVFRSSSVSIIPPILRIHISFLYYRRWTDFTFNSILKQNTCLSLNFLILSNVKKEISRSLHSTLCKICSWYQWH